MANNYINSSIGRKVAMALSALFLLIFLLQHLTINFLSVLNGNWFNEASHFMGTFWLIQYIFQPVLIFGVIFHFIMGFVLEFKNRNAQGVKYAFNKPGASSTWFSRNMIWSGLTLLAFLILHFIDFWIPEINTKYIQGDMSGLHDGSLRYFHELQVKFQNPYRVIAYVIAFVFLAMHLLHGFQSSFQSIGMRHPKYIDKIKTAGNIYAIAVPAGFIFIAIFHFLAH